MRTPFPMLLLLLILVPMAAGCGHQQEQPQVTSKSLVAMTQDQIKEIQNDPKMPPEAKQAAIARLQQNLQVGAAQTGSK